MTSTFLLLESKPSDTPGRKTFIWLEVINWVLFAIFTSVYFGLKSPILGALDTVLGLVLTAWSLLVNYRIDKKAALNILPRFLWLLLAGYVSVYVALMNKDMLFDIGPFIGN